LRKEKLGSGILAAEKTSADVLFQHPQVSTPTVHLFQNQVFDDTGKRWLRVLWNCELGDPLAAGFFEHGFC
jgi:hypothetical protein